MDVSVVLSTYNRAQRLPSALESLAQQNTHGISYEIIAVDNNSSDNTQQVIQSFAEKDGRFRYVFEGRQGLSYGRNAGIAAANANLIVFTDDDIRFSPTWVQNNYEAALRFPDADYIGGRILGNWSGPAPSWVKWTMDPFAFSDLGDQPVLVCPENPHCLVGASLAVRRRAFEKAGLFSTATQRVKDSIGSTEDWDWEVKVWQSGGHGMYVPDVVCYTEVPKNRLSKWYHRRWHAGNGKFHAISGRPELEGSNRLFNVPLFLYRLALQSTLRAIWYACIRHERAFSCELRSWYYFGAIRQKLSAGLRTAEIFRFARAPKAAEFKHRQQTTP